MTTKRFVFFFKKMGLMFILGAFVIGCQTKTVQRNDKKKETPHTPTPSLPVSDGAGTTPVPPLILETEKPPAAEPEELDEVPEKKFEAKVGLILSGGALRTYAHIGVLQEFAKKKIPIVAIGGIEMGSLVAAIYAMKAQAFDVEWQMMKLKEKDLLQKGLMSSKNKTLDVQAMDDFTNMVFGGFKAEQTKVPFTCPSLNMEQQRVYVLTKGSFKEMLPYCMAIPPLFRPFQQNVAGIFSLQVVAEQLRLRGANYIVYVDALSAPIRSDSSEADAHVLWSLAAEASRQKANGINYHLQIQLKGIDMLDFGRRRELIQKGQAAAGEALRTLQKELDL